MINIHDEALIIIHQFSENKIPHVLCGGIATCIHGYVRYTGEIDVLIGRSKMNLAKKVLRSMGYHELGDVHQTSKGLEFSLEYFRYKKIVDDQDLTVVLKLLNPSLRKIWNQKIFVQYRNQQIPVLSRDALICYKRMTGDMQDALDVKKLLDIKNYAPGELRYLDDTDPDLSPSAIESKMYHMNDLFQFGFLLKNAKFAGKIRKSKQKASKRNSRRHDS